MQRCRLPLAPLLALLAARPVSALSLAGVIGTVWQQPSGLVHEAPCDAAVDFDLGCNAFWLSNTSWATYLEQRATMWPLVRHGLGAAPRATVLLYFGAWLADPMHGGVALSRFETVVADISAAGMGVLPFVGRPEFHGAGGVSDTADVVHDAAARAYLTARVGDIVRLPSLRPPLVHAVSVYWMGGYCHAHGPGFCSPSEVHALTASLRDAVRTASGGTVAFLQHLDGPFWDACWPQPCATWDYGGYGPGSLLAAADGLLAESWAMGSLQGGVKALYAAGVVSNETLLLIDDTPNCDTQPTHPCATGSLAGDLATWGAYLPGLGMAGQWAVWDSVDGGTADANFYGDLTSDGGGLTLKGLLHRARALNATAAGAARNDTKG